MNTPDIYSYIKSEENAFETEQIQLGDNWNWNFRDHVQLIFHLKNGIFYTGENNWLRAFKNIMAPLLELAYWTEDIEVKDVVFFIENDNGRALSFLVKKYHDEVYVKEHDVDMLLDEITESDIDYGGVIVQPTNGKRPEVLQLNTIAFCDQKDVLGGPIGFKHHFSPSALRRMSKFGWGKEENGATITLDELITLADNESTPDGMSNTKQNRSTGKTIEVYIIKGDLPEHYLKDNDNMEDVYPQVQIRAFYTDAKKKQHGVCLYRKKDTGESLFFHTSKKVHGRALGRGVGESLLHPQIWTNFLTIHKMNLLESASKVPLYTDDPAYQNRNKIQNMENLEITTIEEGKQIRQVPTAAPANLQLISGAINEWFEHSQLTGAAFDPILGKEATSGTTFRGQERTVAQGKGQHDKRRGQRAKFVEQLYRKVIIPDIVKEIRDGKKFLASLSMEELSWVSDQLAVKHANEKIKAALLKGRVMTYDEVEQIKQTFKQNFAKSGEKKLIEILKGEFEDVEIKMGINIANKQKDLAMLSDKILSIFQFIFANPQAFQQAMQVPALAKSFHDILEFSGLNQVDFMSLTAPVPMPQQDQMNPQAPMQLNPQQAQA